MPIIGLDTNTSNIALPDDPIVASTTQAEEYEVWTVASLKILTILKFFQVTYVGEWCSLDLIQHYLLNSKLQVE